MVYTNLPVQLTSFIGRETDLNHVNRALAEARCVTITGPGGSGKTRLALQVANKISEDFADGVWWVDLASILDPALVSQHVMHALGLRPIVNQPPRESLISYLRPKQVLLVLDNCEHLREACAQLIWQLLIEVPRLRLLATSREALGNEGETLYPLSGLVWPGLPPAKGLDETGTATSTCKPS